ncbi:MAG: hypothetical protein GX647_13470, partial [Clostridiales bacterium]|nr:hypothetical protein [Clostridiales bacterium]
IDGKAEIADMPHRVMLYVEDEGREGGGGLMAKAWSSDFQPDDFDVEEDVKAFLVSPRVMGMDCKVLKKPPEANAKEIEWEDEWTSSNALPYKVSVTLYLRPIKERDDPVAVTRDIELPVWDVSQNPVRSGGRRDEKTPARSLRTQPGAGSGGTPQSDVRGGRPGAGGMPQRQPIAPGGRPPVGGGVP